MGEPTPRLPRRVFIAGLTAALVAGGATALATLGGLTTATTESFRFSRGVSLANGEETRLRGFLATATEDDRIAVVILGHTGTQGEATANIALSEERAETIRAIAQSLGIDAGRISTGGAGGGTPLPREDGQTARAHETSLARADVTLQVRK
ncbi:MAG: OmpA family protein [Pseudomonadota bacterium]